MNTEIPPIIGQPVTGPLPSRIGRTGFGLSLIAPTVMGLMLLLQPG